MTIIRPTTINARFSQPVGLGGEKLWLCPTLGGDRLDLSGNGNHGTYNGGMGTVADKYKGDRAFDFDGVNDYISTGRNVSQTNTQTFSAWSYLDTQASQTFISSCYTSGGSLSQVKVALGVNSSSQPYAVIQNTSAIANAQSSTVLPISQWFHVCGVFIDDGGVKYAKLFVNGNLDTTASGTGSFPIVDDTLVGVTKRSNGAAIALINGLQDDIRVFSRVLTPSEIKHLASYRGVLGSPRQPYDPLKRTVVRVPAAIPAATKVGSIKKPTTIIKPSYQAGYARNASESENPNLWDGLVSWVPSLGSSGSTVRCIQDKSRGIKNDGVTFSGSSEQSLSNGAFLSFDGSDDYMRIYDSSLKNVGGLNPDECLAVRFRRRSLTGTTALFGYLSAGFLGAYGRGFYFDGTTINCMSEQNNNRAAITATVNDNQWHVALANFGASGSFYVDGKLIGTGVLDSSWVYWLQLASASAHTSPPANGANAAVDVSVAYQWNRLLTAGEIKKISVDSLAPFRKKQRVSVAVPAAVAPSATYHPLRSLAHPLEQ